MKALLASTTLNTRICYIQRGLEPQTLDFSANCTFLVYQDICGLSTHFSEKLHNLEIFSPSSRQSTHGMKTLDACKSRTTVSDSPLSGSQATRLTRGAGFNPPILLLRIRRARARALSPYSFSRISRPLSLSLSLPSPFRFVPPKCLFCASKSSLPSLKPPIFQLGTR